MGKLRIPLPVLFVVVVIACYLLMYDLFLLFLVNCLLPTFSQLNASSARAGIFTLFPDVSQEPRTVPGTILDVK